jgi:hypothetical protein
LTSELGRINCEFDPGDHGVLNRRETLLFCNSKGGRQRSLVEMATPLGRFELLALMAREQSDGDPTARLSHRDHPVRDLFALNAATNRAK